MLQPKYMGIAAALGFVLSFLVGIFSRIGFGHIMLRALVCALAFGALCAAILFLNQKFLSDGRTDAEADAPAEKAPRTGGLVDITIDDDRLPEEEQGPRFNVATTRPALRAQADAAPKEEPSASAQESGAEAGQGVPPPADGAPPAPQADGPGFTPMGLAQVASADAGLADLPDIGSFGGAADGDTARDGEFSAPPDEPPAPRRPMIPDGVPASGQSAAVMAQAIRTILAKD